MTLKLVQSILCLVFVSLAINAQVRQERGPSTEERARKLEPFFAESAQRHRIDARILRVLCYLESRYRIEAVSPKGARGPMQFMPETASRYDLRNPHDPKTAIDAGARYFRDLLRRFGGRVDLALAAYNAGEGTVEAFMTGRSLRLANGKVINAAQRITGGIPPYRETQEYVRSAIGFLGNRATQHTESFGSSLRNKKNDVAITNRDFSIDVMANDSLSPLQLPDKAKSSFIEIR
ncbi:MAG: lytic transglycosylase domain-containing protein [Pyrinomonadaceae bacterium]